MSQRIAALSATDMAFSAALLCWAICGAALVVWTMRVHPSVNHAEACRRLDLSVKLYLPWLLSGCSLIFAWSLIA